MYRERKWQERRERERERKELLLQTEIKREEKNVDSTLTNYVLGYIVTY